MRIAILGSVALPVPPPYQGGTEWIAYYQAKGLTSLGYKVILFAARGSEKDNYELVEVGGGDIFKVGGVSEVSKSDQDTLGEVTRRVYPVRSSPDGGGIRQKYVESSRQLRLENVYLSQVIEELLKRKNDFDVILNNMRGEAVFLPSAAALGKPFVNVMHLPLFPELALLFQQYNTPLITISNAQRKDFPDLNYLSTVYNCVDTDKYIFNDKPGSYLLMMGSITPHKNQAAAIRIAIKLGKPLVLAGKIGNQAYYDEIKKDIDGVKIKWIGELGFEEKLKLYQNAFAFLFPVLWEEPFGLVMIEAGSCGTPVVAFGNGAIPEVVVDGKTGFVIENNSEEGMIEAVKNIGSIKREDCRKHVEENFTVDKMVESYENTLRSLGV